MHRVPHHVRHIIGCMTGTSIDGIDAALVQIEGEGLDMRPTLLAQRSANLDHLASELRTLASDEPATAAEFADAALKLGTLHATLCHDLAKQAPAVDLVVLHGQTVTHAPPRSMQLINPWPVATTLGCDVVSDLRGADLAAGGEGAPITPLADFVLYRDQPGDRLIANLGGFCNVTTLPGGSSFTQIRGFDACACNQVLDAVARRSIARPFDRDGATAARGNADERAAVDLRERLLRQRKERRSLGSGDESFGWLDSIAALRPEDQLATCVAGVGSAIGRVLRDERAGATVFVAGGGARNETLLKAIGVAADMPIVLSDHAGVPIEAREAMAMAVLGALADDGIDITLRQVTGRSGSVASAGQWIRGRKTT